MRTMSVDGGDDVGVQREHRRIGDLHTNAPDAVVLAGRVHAVREEQDVQVVLRRDPQRRAGESGMPEARPQDVVPCGASVARRVPAKRTAGEATVLYGGELPDRRGAREAATVDDATIEIGL